MSQSPDVLAELVEASRRRVADQIAPSQRFSAALRADGVSLIAEHKRASPSAGTIRDDTALSEVVAAYAAAGAAALSILTEPTRFGGQIGDIVDARRATELPILRKDFIVDRFQVYEAAAAGADAILLIVAAFADRVDLWGLNRLAGSLGLEVLLEVHDADDLTTALEMRAPIIGINNRNLATLEVDLQTTFVLRDRIPPDTLVVAESGFSTPEQIRELAEAGVDAVLMGRGADARARHRRGHPRDHPGDRHGLTACAAAWSGLTCWPRSSAAWSSPACCWRSGRSASNGPRRSRSTTPRHPRRAPAAPVRNRASSRSTSTMGVDVVLIRAKIDERISSPFIAGAETPGSIATGSGFLVSRQGGAGFILTTCHELEGADPTTRDHRRVQHPDHAAGRAHRLPAGRRRGPAQGDQHARGVRGDL